MMFSVYKFRRYSEERPKAEKQERKEAIKQKPKIIPHKVLLPAKAKVAIILDDAGGQVPNYESIHAIKQKLTISVLPHLRSSYKIARSFRDSGFEIMLHLPMEPDNSSYVRQDSGMVTCNQSEGNIKKTVTDDIGWVKIAVGLNNHLGSKATKDERIMKAVFSALEPGKFYYIDSKTSSQSLAYRIAKSMKFRAAENNVFLDGDADERAIEGRFRELIALARQKGSAVGIGHATRRATIQALKKLMPEYEKSGIKFVFASELVK
jgi:hypothetical protein